MMKCNSFAVISPHRDDAALSLGLALSEWASRGVLIQIINCFTVSDYAPNLPDLDVNQVTAARLTEDMMFAACLNLRPELIDLGQLDAPLRLNCSSNIVCGQLDTPPEDITNIRRSIEQVTNPLGLLVAPLSLGDHVDHMVVHLACLSLATTRPVAFYEDLPYAGEMKYAAIRERVKQTEKVLGRPLRPLKLTRNDAAQCKQRFTEFYSSQLNENEVTIICDYSSRIGGERIWTDDESRKVLEQLPRLSQERALD